jgi:TonB family protein
MPNVLPIALLAALLPNSPAAASSSHPSCAVEHQAAHIIHAETPIAPPLAQLYGLTGTATVRVDLTEDGSVQAAFIVKSAGSPILDRAALKVARSIAYAPETRSCQPISGSYALEVEYAEP